LELAVCNATTAGNKRAIELEEFKAAALQRAGSRNPQIIFKGGLPYHLQACGAVGRPVAGSDRRQYVLAANGCMQNHQHFRVLSLAACDSPAVLLCRFCSHDEGASSRQQLAYLMGKKAMTDLEYSVALQLHKADVLQQYALQVRLPFWHGAVDLMHISTRMCVQIDGIGHFGQQWSDIKQVTLTRDVDCAASALQHGGRMLRISNLDSCGAVSYCAAAVEQPKGVSFVLLSPSYCRAGWWQGNRWLPYIQCMLGELVVRGFKAHAQQLQVGGKQCHLIMTLH
jgi:very-short-patch-repair endonuclease